VRFSGERDRAKQLPQCSRLCLHPNGSRISRALSPRINKALCRARATASQRATIRVSRAFQDGVLLPIHLPIADQEAAGRKPRPDQQPTKPRRLVLDRFGLRGTLRRLRNFRAVIMDAATHLAVLAFQNFIRNICFNKPLNSEQPLISSDSLIPHCRNPTMRLSDSHYRFHDYIYCLPAPGHGWKPANFALE